MRLQVGGPNGVSLPVLTSAPAAPAPGISIFGAAAAKEGEKKTDAPAASTAPAAGTTTGTIGVSTFGLPAASTTAVAPPSMLRGKSIEEIVNRWSTELETHVKEFNKFASEVAVWDRALIENGNNVRLRAVMNPVGP